MLIADLVVLDMRLENAVTVLRQVKEKLGIRTIILDDSDSDEIHAAIRIGVQCVMLIDKVPASLAKAIRDVHAGGKWFQTDYAMAVIDRFLVRKDATGLHSVSTVAQRRKSALRNTFAERGSLWTQIVAAPAPMVCEPY